jgi:hypothetical protein
MGLGVGVAQLLKVEPPLPCMLLFDVLNGGAMTTYFMLALIIVFLGVDCVLARGKCKCCK